LKNVGFILYGMEVQNCSSFSYFNNFLSVHRKFQITFT
jgi:hypothetical protein